MSEQLENTNDELESDDPEYDGDLGDGAKTRGTGSGAGIIGINPT